MKLDACSEVITKYNEKDIVIFDDGDFQITGVVINGYTKVDRCSNKIDIYYDILTTPDNIHLGNYKIYRGIREDHIIAFTTINKLEALLAKLDLYEEIQKEIKKKEDEVTT